MSNPDRQEERPQSSRRPGAPAPQADPRRPGAAPATLKPEELRTVLSHLQTPHRLDTPEIRALLAHHRRLPPSLSPTAVGAAAAELLTDQIAALDPGPDAPPGQRLPHLVLDASFVRARKNFQAAAELGLSERQLTRERARALQLLAAELAAPAPPALPAADEIPSLDGLLPRPELLRRLAETIARRRLVAITGDAGAGKTLAAAALAHSFGAESTWWYRVRRGVNDSLEALLHELGQVLARDGCAELRDYLAAHLADVDLGKATRLALEGLAGRRRLLIIDDFGRVRDPKALEEFLCEITERLPSARVVTVGAGPVDAELVEVPPLTRSETAALFRARGLYCATHVLDAVHQLAHGNVRMLAAIAAWWSGDDRGLVALERHLEGREALANMTDLFGFAQTAA